MSVHSRRFRTPVFDLEQLLVVTTVGVYLLVILGAGTAVLDGAATCSSWPVCTESLLSGELSASILVAFFHRATAGLVGVVVLVTVLRTWREASDARVRFAITLMAVLYPIQMVLGALIVTGGTGTLLPLSHLGVGLLIFTSGIAGLTWQLDEKQRQTRPAAAGPSFESAEADGGDSAQRERNQGTVSDSNGAHGFEAAFLGTAMAYVRLMKPKLMWLLCLVALAAMALAAGPALRIETVVPTLLGGVLAIGASGTFNNVFERDVDEHMERTSDRPLVTGQIPVWRASLFGVGLTVGSVAVFATFVNLLAALLGLLAILFYSVVYTLLLKPNTAQNTVIGGAVGAFPALIGWAAVTEQVGVPALVLGAVIFLWTPAHFYNLALVYRDQYEAAGIPMYPVVHGVGRTRIHVLGYFAATMGAVVVLGSVTNMGLLFTVVAAVLGGVFLWTTIDLFESGTDEAALRTFVASNTYLGLLLVAILGDSLLV